MLECVKLPRFTTVMRLTHWSVLFHYFFQLELCFSGTTPSYRLPAKKVIATSANYHQMELLQTIGWHVVMPQKSIGLTGYIGPITPVRYSDSPFPPVLCCPSVQLSVNSDQMLFLLNNHIIIIIIINAEIRVTQLQLYKLLQGHCTKHTVIGQEKIAGKVFSV